MPLRPRIRLVVAGLAGVAVGLRLINAFSYPPDWGFDASFNWRYILRLSEDWALPSPEVGWSTSDPPLYFAIAAALWSAFDRNLVVVPLMNTGFGLGIVALAVFAVRRIAPGHPYRAWLAAGLLLYLPAHIHMSMMVNEEILVSLFASLALFHVAWPGRLRPLAAAARVGAWAGLAMLTKLGGVLAAAAAAASYVCAGRRDGPGIAARKVAVTLLVAGVVGGWFYARNRIVYGYFQPEKLPVHEVMFDMPPGHRSVADYLYVPFATWTDPRLNHPDLLRSVWGSTYASAWFDGHRFLLPRDDPAVTAIGTATLLLALLPTGAFGVGLWRAARRSLRDPSAPDVPLVIYTGLTLAGYAYFSWVNPYFVVLKGTSLLSLSLPFAVFASEVLADWIARGRSLAPALLATLAALAVLVVVGSTFDLAFEKGEVSGLPWERVAPDHEHSAR